MCLWNTSTTWPELQYGIQMHHYRPIQSCSVVNGRGRNNFADADYTSDRPIQCRLIHIRMLIAHALTFTNGALLIYYRMMTHYDICDENAFEMKHSLTISKFYLFNGNECN